MRIAGIQMSAGPDVAKNVTRAVEMAEVAAEKGAKVIGFSELCLTPWFPRREDRSRFSLAQEVAGEVISTFHQNWRKVSPPMSSIPASLFS